MFKVVFVVCSIFVCLAKSGDEDRRGLCWCEKHQKAFSPGDKWVSNGGGGECARYECREGGLTECVSCGQIHLPKGCGYHLGEPDHSKPYPECCPQVIKD